MAKEISLRDSHYPSKTETVGRAETKYQLRKNGLHYTSTRGGYIKRFEGFNQSWRNVVKNLRLSRIVNKKSGDCHSYLNGVRVHTVFLYRDRKQAQVWDSDLNSERPIDYFRKSVAEDLAKIKAWRVWSEGYRATGEMGTAIFKDAVQDYVSGLSEKNKETVDMEKLTIWGCKFFDNETDARGTFG